MLRVLLDQQLELDMSNVSLKKKQEDEAYQQRIKELLKKRLRVIKDEIHDKEYKEQEEKLK